MDGEAPTFLWPVKVDESYEGSSFAITAMDIYYDGGDHGRLQNALDINHDGMTTRYETREIVAAAAGEVIDVHDCGHNALYCPSRSCEGSYIKIRHEIPDENGEIQVYITAYVHLDPDTFEVQEGDYVEQGQTIARMGSTGNSSGIHLHFAIRDENNQDLPTLEFYMNETYMPLLSSSTSGSPAASWWPPTASTAGILSGWAKTTPTPTAAGSTQTEGGRPARANNNRQETFSCLLFACTAKTGTLQNQRTGSQFLKSSCRSAHVKLPALPAGRGLGQLFCRVAQNAVANALVVAFNAPALQQHFALYAVKLLPGAVDPAAAQAQLVGLEHHVAHHQAAVVHVGGHVPVGQHHQHHRRAVKGVAAHSHDLGVQAGKVGALALVGHGHHHGALCAAAAGGVKPGFYHLVDERFAHVVGFVAAHAPARFKKILHLLYLLKKAVRGPAAWGPFLCFLYPYYSTSLARGLFFPSQLRRFQLLMDKDDNLIRPFVSWQDIRGGNAMIDKLCKEIPRKEFYRITGDPLGLLFSVTKLMWLNENEPENMKRCAHVLDQQDYFLRLFGADGYYTDTATASRNGMLDIDDLCWSEELHKIVGLPLSKRSEIIKEPGKILAHVPKHIAEQTGLKEGTPVCLCSFDQNCNTFGSGGIKDGTAVMVMGTFGSCFVVSDKSVRDPQGVLVVKPNQGIGNYTIEACSNTCASSYRWYRDTFGDFEKLKAAENGRDPYDLINEQIATVPPGSNGVTFLNYLQGASGAKINDRARATFLGMTIGTTKADMARAVMEGICFEMNDIIKAEQAAGIQLNGIRLTGGAAKSPCGARCSPTSPNSPFTCSSPARPAAWAPRCTPAWAWGCTRTAPTLPTAPCSSPAAMRPTPRPSTLTTKPTSALTIFTTRWTAPSFKPAQGAPGRLTPSLSLVVPFRQNRRKPRSAGKETPHRRRTFTATANLWNACAANRRCLSGQRAKETMKTIQEIDVYERHEFLCDCCGKVHVMPVGEVCIEAGAAKKLPEYVQKLAWAKRACSSPTKSSTKAWAKPSTKAGRPRGWTSRCTCSPAAWCPTKPPSAW